jgi:hypothetical protein
MPLPPRPPTALSDVFSLADQRPTTSTGPYGEYDIEEEYEDDSEDEDVFAFLPPRAGQSQPLDDGPRPTTTAAANVAFPTPAFNPYARFPAESVYSGPPPPSQPESHSYQLQPPPSTPPSTSSHSNHAENEPYRLKRLSNAVPTTAVSSVGARRPVSSKEVRVNLPSSDGEPRSRSVTKARGESIVSAPISAAGDAECCFSDDMDRSMLEEVKAPPSIPESVSITPSMLEEDATSREGSIK